MTERGGYKKIPLVEFKDIYKTDLQNLFRPNPIIFRGVLTVVTQISTRTWAFSGEEQGGILGFMPTSPELGTPLSILQVSYILASNRVGQDD